MAKEVNDNENEVIKESTKKESTKKETANKTSKASKPKEKNTKTTKETPADLFLQGINFKRTGRIADPSVVCF